MIGLWILTLLLCFNYSFEKIFSSSRSLSLSLALSLALSLPPSPSVTIVFVLVLLLIGMCATHQFDPEDDQGGWPILLPSAVVAIYVTYLCYSSISQFPDPANDGKCNWLL